MELMPDQVELFETLVGKLDARRSEEGILAYVGEVLQSLLRRKGDAEFLVAVRNAFTQGIRGRSADEQRLLAREVIRLVIVKRPEIARAWHAMYGAAEGDPPARRRSTDRLADDRAEIDGTPAGAENGATAVVPYVFAGAENLVADHVAGVLARKLEAFHIPLPVAPTTAYCSLQPFFLFTSAFTEAVRNFVKGPLIELERQALERHVYRFATPARLSDPEKCRTFLGKAHPRIWKIVGGRLTKLASHHANAVAKMRRAERLGLREKNEPRFQVVKMPVKVPRVYSVFGVRFQIGEETVMRQMRVPVQSANDLDPSEAEAMALMTTFRQICLDHGVAIPDQADFQFLRCLFDFQSRKYAKAVNEFIMLAGHPTTSRNYLMERLSYVDKTYNNYLSDALVLAVFYTHADGPFPFKHLYDICIGTASNRAATVSKRPFVQDEVSRRPLELVFQVRDLLRQGRNAETVGEAAKKLLTVWRVLSTIRYKKELAAATEALQRLPEECAGTPSARTARLIANILEEVLASPAPDDQAALAAVRAVLDGMVVRSVPVPADEAAAADADKAPAGRAGRLPAATPARPNRQSSLPAIWRAGSA